MKLKRNKKCQCSRIRYNPQFDAYYCEKCDHWMEESCGDPQCRFCPERPFKPSLCVEEDDES